MAMKRGHIIIAGAAFFLILTLIVTISVIATAKFGDTEEKTCETTACIQSSLRVFENMDSRINPCDDFYRFACGGFEESTIIPRDKTSVSTFSLVDEKLVGQLKKSIEEPITDEEPKPFKLLKKFYLNCMNTSAIERAGLKPLHDILKQFGNWPVLEGKNWKENAYSWVKHVKKSRDLGYSNDFIEISVGVDLKNSTKRIIELDRPHFGLPRAYLSRGVNDPIVKAYLKYMIDISVVLGADRKKATQELTESLKFEISLANISLPDVRRKNATLLYNLMSISEMNKQYPSLDWTQYINELLSPTVKVDGNEIVTVIEPEFVRNFEILIKNTPKRVQANYALWRVIKRSVSYLTKDLRDKQLIYYTVLSGETERKSRWKECVDIVSNKMEISTGAFYVRKHFNVETKKKAAELTDDIKNEMIKILEQAEWMDENTKSKAVTKAASIFGHIAYPDELLDDKILDEYYSDLEFKPNDFIGNFLNLTRFETSLELKKFNEPVNKSEWIRHSQSAVINAFYDFLGNSLQLPAGILQSPIFSSDRPQYMNYGSIGFIIGHEMTHGFDDQGRQFDKEGNLVDWWAPATKEKYLEKAECIINQYGNYSVESVGLNLNGINTQGENIADNGGVKEAYLAYKEYVRRNGPEPKLPGLNYTPEQMFWISVGNTWCIKYRPEELKNDITVDVHSPAEFRVLGTLSNRPEFADDFHCPIGSRMNPKNKCSLW